MPSARQSLIAGLAIREIIILYTDHKSATILAALKRPFGMLERQFQIRPEKIKCSNEIFMKRKAVLTPDIAELTLHCYLATTGLGALSLHLTRLRQ
jgi:hypothetical protein